MAKVLARERRVEPAGRPADQLGEFSDCLCPPGALSALSVCHSQSGFCGAFLWVHSGLNSLQRRFLARAERGGGLPRPVHHPRRRPLPRLGTPETGAQEIFNPENPYGKYFLGLYLTLFLGSRIASAGRWLPVRRRAVAGERQQAGVRHADQVAAGAR